MAAQLSRVFPATRSFTAGTDFWRGTASAHQARRDMGTVRSRTRLQRRTFDTDPAESGRAGQRAVFAAASRRQAGAGACAINCLFRICSKFKSSFDLPSPALVEKDWYVVTALAAINTADVKPFRLVFSGGTALSRAHRLIRRMSEDIDLKIVSDEPRSRPELRTLRDTITSALLLAGFQFDPDNAAHRDSGNASRYTIYHLPYAPIVAGEGTLRPEIQIETAVWPLRLPSVERP